MPLRRMPNGAYVNVPADITPEGFARLSARYAAKSGPAGRSAPASDGFSKRDRENASYVDKTVGELKGAGSGGAMGRVLRGVDALAHGASFGADDVVSSGLDAATSGAVEAFKKRDIGEIGRRYSNNRTALKRYRSEIGEENPIATGAGTVIGILKNPLGAETGVARLADAGGKALTRFAPATAGLVGSARGGVAAAKASKVGRGIAALGGTAGGVGARAGFNQGAATAVMDGKTPEDVLNEGATGALYGGAASALLKGGQYVYRTARNQAPDQAKRIAMERVASLLDRSEDPLTKSPFTPATVQREIRATDAAGGDAMLADLTPEGQGWASYLAKQPGNTAASGLINRAEERAAGAADRFETRVRKQLGIGQGAPDAHTAKKAIKEGRKAAGAAGYSDDVMDRQLAWNDDLEKLFKGGNPAITDALPHAEKMVRIDGGDVQQLAFSKMGDPKNATMTKVPSMRTMQYVTQGLDDIVGKAVRAGDTNLARAYSKVNRQLKDAVAKANPEFAQANAVQRDFFERENSVTVGTEILKKLRTGKAREVLDEIKAGKIKPDDAKLGLADALMHLRESGDNPVALMRRFMRSDDQRKVLAHMFGGNKSLNEFERFMRRELRGSHTDSMVSSGRQMQANLLRDQPPGGDVETLADIGKAGLQGAAFGGPMGSLSRMIASAGKWGQFLSPSAKAELSRVLSGKGEGLEESLKKLRREALKTRARDRKLAIAAGKAPNAVVGGYSEQ